MSELDHAKRAINIGGSEIASLFYSWEKSDGKITFFSMFDDVPEGYGYLGCVSNHTTGYRLFMDKSHRMEPKPVEGERIDAGTFMEPAIAEWARKKWDDFKIQQVHRYIEVEGCPGMGASRDYEEVTKGHPPVEIKNVDYIVYKETWAEDDDGNITRPPLHIILQLQHQIEGTGAEYGWIVVCIAGNELKRVRIPRHEPTIEKIKKAIGQFWANVKLEKSPDDYIDMDTIAELWSQGFKGSHIDLTADNEMPVLCSQYLQAKVDSNSAEAEQDRLKAKITSRMTEHTVATVQGFKVSWPTVHREAKIKTVEVTEKDWRGGLTVTPK